jgi:hypothetical protein
VRAVACHMICLLRRLCLLCQLLCSKEIKVAALMPAKACTVMSFLDGGMLRRQKRWVKVILCFVATGQLNVFDYSLQMKRIISVPVGKLILIFCCRCGTMHKNMLLYSIILCNTNILRLIVAHFLCYYFIQIVEVRNSAVFGHFSSATRETPTSIKGSHRPAARCVSKGVRRIPLSLFQSIKGSTLTKKIISAKGLSPHG